MPATAVNQLEPTELHISTGRPEGSPPFLRWAGGKQWLSATITSLVSFTYHCYFEPFLGGGSVFFNLRPRKSVLGDLNPSLVTTYKAVRDDPLEVLHWLSKWRNDKGIFYALRAARFSNVAKCAAQFIYLNKTCWNGLYRVNRQGRFNVPFGNNVNRQTHDRAAILSASALLKNAHLETGDFESLLTSARESDLVYLDPPYTVLHSQNGFRRYNETLFSWQDQQRLAIVARRLTSAGCYVIVSNAPHPEILDLYAGFLPFIVKRPSSLASNPRFRRQVQECILLSSNLRSHILVD
jgi:DNA adenine methylase